MTSSYTRDDIPRVRAEIAAMKDDLNESDKDWLNGNPLNSRCRLLQLLEAGADRVEAHQYGYLLKGRYIVAAQKNRWCVVGKMKWYWFGSIADLVAKLK